MTAMQLREMLADNPVVGERREGARRFWTGREEKILRETYPVSGIEACLTLLPGRSANAIYQHAGALGLNAPRRATPHKREPYATSDHIDASIRHVYQTKPGKNAIGALARAVGRPRWWVSKRAQKLGLVTPRFKEPDWTDEETTIVSDAAHKSPKALRGMLKRRGFERTETAIIIKLKRLGCTREDPDHYTAAGLAGLMGIDTKTVTRWIEKGWLKADRRGTERTAIQGGDQWWIHRRAVRRFIVENVAVVDLRKVDKFWAVDLLAGPSSSNPTSKGD